MGNLVVGPIEPATNLGLSNDAYLAVAFFAINAAFLFISYALSAIPYSSRTIDEAPKDVSYTHLTLPTKRIV